MPSSLLTSVHRTMILSIIKILAMKQYATEQLIYADVVDFKKFLCLPLYTRMQHASFNILASQLYVVYAKCQLAKIYRFRSHPNKICYVVTTLSSLVPYISLQFDFFLWRSWEESMLSFLMEQWLETLKYVFILWCLSFRPKFMTLTVDKYYMICNVIAEEFYRHLEDFMRKLALDGFMLLQSMNQWVPLSYLLFQLL